MRKLIVMELYSKREITPENAREQIQALSDFDGGAFRPVLCDAAEPLKERFDPSDIREPIRWLSQAGADFKFKRAKPFGMEGYISNRHQPQMWTRETKLGPLVPIVPKFPEPRFLTSWTIWFDWSVLTSIGVERLREFLVEMFLISDSEYGFVTPEDDHKNKNFLVLERGGTTTTKFVGTDPEHGIPGLYWINIFGPKLSEWLGPKLKNVSTKVQSVGEGSTLVEFGASPEAFESVDVRTQQRQALADLGEDKFFDIKHPERRPASLFVDPIRN